MSNRPSQDVVDTAQNLLAAFAANTGPLWGPNLNADAYKMAKEIERLATIAAPSASASIEPFCWYTVQRDITDEYVTVFSEHPDRPKGNGDWKPLYASTSPEAAQQISGIPLIKRLHAQRDRVAVVLRRLRQWDMMDATADGSFWKGEIDKALEGIPTEEEQLDNVLRGLAEIMTEDAQSGPGERK